MKFAGLNDFRTRDPELLRSDLQREHRAVAEALTDLERMADPLPTTVLVSAEHRARFFESILTDSTNGNVPVRLPQITLQDEGKFVDVGRRSTANTVTVLAWAPQKIQGAAQVTLAASLGYARFRVIRGEWWKQV